MAKDDEVAFWFQPIRLLKRLRWLGHHLCQVADAVIEAQLD